MDGLQTSNWLKNSLKVTCSSLLHQGRRMCSMLFVRVPARLCNDYQAKFHETWWRGGVRAKEKNSLNFEAKLDRFLSNCDTGHWPWWRTSSTSFYNRHYSKVDFTKKKRKKKDCSKENLDILKPFL